jgi:uncharacterized protein (TIGR00369 family)
LTSETREAAANLAEVTLGGRRIRYAPHRCFACGELNEHGLHMTLHVQDERCWSELTLDERFQGWDGIIHGGILSTVLDEVMAWSLVARDSWGVTARLNVTYHKPVEVGRRIRAEGHVTDGRRRVSRTAATIADAGTGELLASAEGVYVAASEERRVELKARYRFRLVPEERPAPEPARQRAPVAGREAG